MNNIVSLNRWPVCQIARRLPCPIADKLLKSLNFSKRIHLNLKRRIEELHCEDLN